MPKIEITKEQAQALAQGKDITISTRKKGRVKPDEKQLIFRVSGDNRILEHNSFMDSYWNAWSEYIKQEQAQKEAEYRQAVADIRTYIAENFEPFVPDWSNQQSKYFPFYNYRYNEWFVNNFSRDQFMLPFPHLATREHCEQLIKDCFEELEITRTFDWNV